MTVSTDIAEPPEELVRRIAERVRPVCSDWPEEEFRALVRRMAIVQRKYATMEPDRSKRQSIA